MSMDLGTTYVGLDVHKKSINIAVILKGKGSGTSYCPFRVFSRKIQR